MTSIIVVAIIYFETRPRVPLTTVMNRRLERFAAELQSYLDLELHNDESCVDLVVYLSYNSNYGVRWAVTDDVPQQIVEIVSQKCAKLGYVVWKGVDLYRFK